MQVVGAGTGTVGEIPEGGEWANRPVRVPLQESSDGSPGTHDQPWASPSSAVGSGVRRVCCVCRCSKVRSWSRGCSSRRSSSLASRRASSSASRRGTSRKAASPVTPVRSGSSSTSGVRGTQPYLLIWVPWVVGWFLGLCRSGPGSARRSGQRLRSGFSIRRPPWPLLGHCGVTGSRRRSVLRPPPRVACRRPDRLPPGRAGPR